MIEGTLNLKRFTDKAVAGLFAIKPEIAQMIQKVMAPPEQIVRSTEIPLTVPEKKRLIELEDSIRIGMKAGMGSRQNAPAEWIGRSHP